MDANANTDINVINNLGIGIEGIISNNDDDNSKTKYFKIVNFFINNIIDHGYSIQLRNKIIKLIKNLLGLKISETTRAIKIIVKPFLNILNFISFLSIIDQIILSNL